MLLPETDALKIVSILRIEHDILMPVRDEWNCNRTANQDGHLQNLATAGLGVGLHDQFHPEFDYQSRHNF